MSFGKVWIVTACLTLGTPVAALASSAQALIPRAEIFGNPTRTGVTLSPDGRWMAYIAPRDGVLNLWVAPFGQWENAKAVTQDKKRGIRSYSWANNGRHILYVQDNNGDENWRIYRVDVASAKVEALTPAGKARASIAHLSKSLKDEILIEINDRDPRYSDIHRINLNTGERKLVFKNDGYQDLFADDTLTIRLATKPIPGGSLAIHKVDAKGKVETRPFLEVPSDDSLSSRVLGFDLKGDQLYVLDSRTRDKAALTQIDMKSGKAGVLAAGNKADIASIISDPRTLKPQATMENYLKAEWTAMDPKIQADLDFLKRETRGIWTLLSRTDDEKYWVLAIDRVTEPLAYYLYESPAKKLTRLFTSRPELEGKRLAPMHGLEIPARDGVILPSYLSLPPDADPDGDGKPAKALPMVLLVHGGPWSRDNFGFNPTHQWLANRGLAVLSVNYRGSTGFGKDFINKANREFAGAMHHDLLDAVDWAVKQGVAQKDKVGIMGGSYGGYATLVGMTFTPDTFACGVDIVGPSNLVTLIENFPAYWQPFLESTWYKRAGNPSLESDRKDLLARSPITKVQQIKKPLLIGQGATDPRVTQKESDQIVAAMKARSIPVTYALYPDEGHGFQIPENRISFNSLTENFLAKCLGTAAQPIGQDLVGSSLQLPEGREHIPGLKETFEALKK